MFCLYIYSIVMMPVSHMMSTRETFAKEIKASNILKIPHSQILKFPDSQNLHILLSELGRLLPRTSDFSVCVGWWLSVLYHGFSPEYGWGNSNRSMGNLPVSTPLRKMSPLSSLTTNRLSILRGGDWTLSASWREYLWSLCKLKIRFYQEYRERSRSWASKGRGWVQLGSVTGRAWKRIFFRTPSLSLLPALSFWSWISSESTDSSCVIW